MQFSTVRMAWRNLGRNKRRTGLALLAIGVGQFALLASNGIMHGYMDNIKSAVTGPMVGHVQVYAPGWWEERAMDLAIEGLGEVLEAVRSDGAVRNAAGRIFAPVLVAPKADAFTAVVVGLETAIEGQPYGMLSGLAERVERGRVLLGYRLAKKIKAERGQEIAIVGQGADGSLANDLFVVQDIIKCPADLINQSGVVMELADAQDLFVMPDAAHMIVVRAEISGVAEELAERFEQQEALAGLDISPWQEIVPELLTILDTADYVGYIVLVLVFIAAIAGITNTLMMSTFERRHEFGMLLALGSRPSRIVGMIVIEAILLGIAGVVVGTGLGYGFVAASSFSGIDMASWGGESVKDIAYSGLNLPLHVYPRLEVFDTVLGLTAVMLTSLAASLWPAWYAGRLEPREALHG